MIHWVLKSFQYDGPDFLQTETIWAVYLKQMCFRVVFCQPYFSSADLKPTPCIILALAIIDGSEQQLSPFVFSLFTHPRICVSSSPSRGLLWHLIFHLVKKLFNFRNFQVIREIFMSLVQKKWSRNRSKWNEKRNLPEVIGYVTRKYKIIYDWIKNITDFTLNRIRNNDKWWATKR